MTNLNGKSPSTVNTLTTLYVSVDYMSFVVCKIDKCSLIYGSKI